MRCSSRQDSHLFVVGSWWWNLVLQAVNVVHCIATTITLSGLVSWIQVKLKDNPNMWILEYSIEYLWGKVGVQPKKRLDVWCQGALSWTSGALRIWRLNHSNLVHDKLWITFGRKSIRLSIVVAAATIVVVVVVKCMLLALSEGEILSHQIYSRREPRCGQRNASYRQSTVGRLMLHHIRRGVV
jgi:hypothetical protein